MKNYTKKKQVDGISRREKATQAVSEKILNRGVLSSALKVCGMGMVALLLFVGISFTGSTVAYFNDTEYSTGNRLQAGVLGFNLTNAGYGHEYASTTEENIGTAAFEVVIEPTTDSLPLSLIASGHLDPGNPDCDELSLEASFGDYQYTGLLKDFVSAPQNSPGEWHFFVSLPTTNALAPMEECEGEIVFDAGLADVSSDLVHTFSDHKTYPFEIYNWASVGGGASETESIVEETPVETPVETIVEEDAIPSEEVTPPTEETPPQETEIPSDPVL